MTCNVLDLYAVLSEQNSTQANQTSGKQGYNKYKALGPVKAVLDKDETYNNSLFLSECC